VDDVTDTNQPAEDLREKIARVKAQFNPDNVEIAVQAHLLGSQ